MDVTISIKQSFLHPKIVQLCYLSIGQTQTHLIYPTLDYPKSSCIYVHWFIQHLVHPTPGSSNTWFIPHQVYPTPGLSDTWFIRHLVHPTPGLPNTWFTQHLVYPTPGLSDTWFIQHLVHPTPGLSDTWFIQHLVYPTPGLSNTWFIQHLVYPTPGLPNTWFIQHLVYPTPGLSNTWFIQHLVYLTHFMKNRHGWINQGHCTPSQSTTSFLQTFSCTQICLWLHSWCGQSATTLPKQITSEQWVNGTLLTGQWLHTQNWIFPKGSAVR